MRLRDARDAYLEASGLGDGGYDLPWVKLQMGPVPLAIPNTASRKRAVPLHDLHHCLTGYGTDWAGEFEISAWEIASNCRGYGFAWYINLQGPLAGVFYSPRRTWRAWVRGRRCRNLYAVGFSDALLERRVDELQRELHLDRPAPQATLGCAASFALALVASVVVSFGPLLVPVLAVRALLA